MRCVLNWNIKKDEKKKWNVNKKELMFKGLRGDLQRFNWYSGKPAFRAKIPMKNT